jgi:hypothetical protein
MSYRHRLPRQQKPRALSGVKPKVRWGRPPNSAIFNWDGTRGTRDLYANVGNRVAWVEAPVHVPGEEFTKKVRIGKTTSEMKFWKPTEHLMSGWSAKLGTFQSEHGWDFGLNWLESQAEAKRVAEEYLRTGKVPTTYKMAKDVHLGIRARMNLPGDRKA